MSRVAVRRRVAMTASSIALAGAAAVGLASAASAESIDDFQTAVTVNADTSFTVVETIQYDFGGLSRHGIFRDIPKYDVLPDDSRRTYGITVNSVTIDGQAAIVETSEDGPYIHLQVGDPDRTIYGQHTYVISYTVANGLRVITAQDMSDPAMPAGISAGDVEMYWDLVGSGWQVPVRNAQASVAGPGAIISAKCFTGAQGATSTCPVMVESNAVAYGPVLLRAEAGLTGVTVWPASAFSRVPTEDIRAAPINPVYGLAVGLIPAALLIIGPIIFAVSRRREDRGVVFDGAPPQYSPPDDLSPAELVISWTGVTSTAGSTTMVATLVDLAARRWINLSSEGDHLHVTWVGSGSKPMRPWEESLIGAVLKGQPAATLAGYDPALADTWSNSRSAMQVDADASGRRNLNGGAPDQRWWWLVIVAGVAVAVAILLAVLGLGFLAALAGTTAVGAAVGFVAARIITPRQETAKSAQFAAQVRGFQRVLGTDASASRREFAQRLGLPPEAVFATMLPYAIVLGLKDSWSGAFPDLTPDQLAGQGFEYVGVAVLLTVLDRGGSSLVPPPPVSTGTSADFSGTDFGSGSGGGGSSGGGGGGGGGGSW